MTVADEWGACEASSTAPPHLLPRSPLFFILIFPPPVSLITPPLIPEEMADGGFTALEAWIVFPFSRSRARQLCPQCPSLSVTVIRLLRYESQRHIRANSPGNKVGCGQNGRGGAFHCCIFMTTVPAENRDGFSFMSEINESVWNSRFLLFFCVLANNRKDKSQNCSGLSVTWSKFLPARLWMSAEEKWRVRVLGRELCVHTVCVTCYCSRSLVVTLLCPRVIIIQEKTCYFPEIALWVHFSRQQIRRKWSSHSTAASVMTRWILPSASYNIFLIKQGHFANNG